MVKSNPLFFVKIFQCLGYVVVVVILQFFCQFLFGQTAADQIHDLFYKFGLVCICWHILRLLSLQPTKNIQIVLALIYDSIYNHLLIFLINFVKYQVFF